MCVYAWPLVGAVCLLAACHKQQKLICVTVTPHLKEQCYAAELKDGACTFVFQDALDFLRNLIRSGLLFMLSGNGVLKAGIRS